MTTYNEILIRTLPRKNRMAIDEELKQAQYHLNNRHDALVADDCIGRLRRWLRSGPSALQRRAKDN
jgi:hypothetical protein